MKSPLVIFLLIVLFFSTSCKNTDAPKKESAFLEVENYFAAEISALQKSDLALNKMLEHQGITEEILVENPNWSKELVPFTETISNQPAPVLSYNRDSILTEKSKLLVLKAKEATATVKSLTVYTTNGSTDSIIIIKNVSNVYYSSSDTFTYYGQGNYLIKAENLPGIGKKIGFVLKGKTSAKATK